MRNILRISVILACVATEVYAGPVLPSLFTDHMVLQRDRAVPVWGWAEPSEIITISFDGKSLATTADAKGRWKIELPPHTAGGPFTLTVSGRGSLQVRDVLVGEVWLASGQSNMTFPLGNTTTAVQDVPAASSPSIRLFTVPKATSLEPFQRFDSAWQVCTPESARPFSAVSYYFARALAHRLHVPIGVIHSGWPGTQAEEWTDPASLASRQEFQPIVERWNASPDKAGTEQQAAKFDMLFDRFEMTARDGSAPLHFGSFDDGATAWTFGWSSAPRVAFDLVKQGAAASGTAGHLAGELRANESAPLHAVVAPDGHPVDLSRSSAVRFSVRGHGFFRVYLLQPSITDSDNYGSPLIEAKQDWTEVNIPFTDFHQAGWGKKHEFTPQAITGVVIEPLISRNPMRPPAGLYNAMIAPLLPYAIRGAIWYQGEGNAGRAHQYKTLLPAMIQGWRHAWAEGDFPFLIVQLPNYRQRRPEPSESDWAELREAQLKTLSLPNTGMAVTIDLGEADDVHPRDKRVVGARLAKWALGAVYGTERVYSGPLYESLQVEGSRVRLRFRDTGSGLTSLDNQPLRGFAIAGPDKRFVWATATIDKDTIVVSSPDVKNPVAVRYAWADNPDCNLGNIERLPASPFRTDTWPGITADHR